MRSGAHVTDEIKSQLLLVDLPGATALSTEDFLRAAPKTMLERGRLALDFIAPANCFQRGS